MAKVRIVFVGGTGPVTTFDGRKIMRVMKKGDAKPENIFETTNVPRATNCVKSGDAVWWDGPPEEEFQPEQLKVASPPVSDLGRMRQNLRAPKSVCPMWAIIATRDRPEHAAKQTGLLLQQGVDKVVVVNDAGEDVSLPKDKRVLYLKLGEPGGPNAARDAGIKQSPADAVIVEADDHDFVEDGAVQALRDVFRDTRAWVAYGDHWNVNSKGERNPLRGFTEKGEYPRWGFRDMGALHTGIRAYRRSLYGVVGGYRMSETPGGDLGLMMRFEHILDCRGIVHIPRPLCSVMVSMTGLSRASKKAQGTVCRRLRMAARAGFAVLFAPEGAGPAVGGGFQQLPEPQPPDFSGVGEETVRPFPTDMRWGPGQVCAVVPSFNTRGHLVHCLDNLAREGVPVVVVDDACPQGSAAEALAHPHPTIEVVKLSKNTGFSHAVNVGARRALDRGAASVLVLNADAFVDEGAVEAMLTMLDSDKNIGVVGNTHVSNIRRETQSQGSEWKEKYGCYQHVGRGIKDPIPGDAPKDRDAVTFACALVRGECWRRLGGLDERYLKAYWEDIDFCLRARQDGWRVVWSGCPETEHVCGASHGRNGKLYEENRRLFYARWRDTGLIDKFARERGVSTYGCEVVACMIVAEEEEFVGAAMESVAPLVDRFVVAVGSTEAGAKAGWCGPDGLPKDRTLEIVRAFKGRPVDVILPPGGKLWPHKRDMRQATADRVKSDSWVIVQDGDEVWTEEGLWRLSRHMHEANAVIPGGWVVWNNMDTVGTGAWDRYFCVRAIKWRKGFNWTHDDNMPHDAHGRPLGAIPHLRVARVTGERLFLHYSWVRPLEKIRRKVAYYDHKPSLARRPRPDYVDRVFLAWRKDPQKIEQQFGTHPFGEGGTTTLHMAHPPSVQRLIDAGEVGGEGW